MGRSADGPCYCPKCGGKLRRATVCGVTVTGCDACGGCWFEHGWLEVATDLPAEPLEALALAFTPGLGDPTVEGSGRCPQCGVKLVERLLEPSLLAAHGCPSCDGVWLDQGRLGALAAMAPAQRHPPAAATPPPETIRCPHCGERHPAGTTTCGGCGRTMIPPPAGMPGELFSRHRLDWATTWTELTYAGWALAVAWLLWQEPAYRRDESFGLTTDFEQLLSIAAAVLVVWYGRWAFKTWSIDLHAGGLTVRRLTGLTFIPWSAMRRIVTLDLPGRVRREVFASFVRRAATQFPRAGKRVYAEPLRGAVWVFTDHGLVTIGPHLTDSGELYRVVRQHWDG